MPGYVGFFLSIAVIVRSARFGTWLPTGASANRSTLLHRGPGPELSMCALAWLLLLLQHRWDRSALALGMYLLLSTWLTGLHGYLPADTCYGASLLSLETSGFLPLAHGTSSLCCVPICRGWGPTPLPRGCSLLHDGAPVCSALTAALHAAVRLLRQHQCVPPDEPSPRSSWVGHGVVKFCTSSVSLSEALVLAPWSLMWSLITSFTPSFVIHSFPPLFPHSFIYSLIHFLPYSLPPSLLPSFTHTHSLPHSLIQSLIHSLPHSFT